MEEAKTRVMEESIDQQGPEWSGSVPGSFKVVWNAAEKEIAEVTLGHYSSTELSEPIMLGKTGVKIAYFIESGDLIDEIRMLVDLEQFYPIGGHQDDTWLCSSGRLLMMSRSRDDACTLEWSKRPTGEYGSIMRDNRDFTNDILDAIADLLVVGPDSRDRRRREVRQPKEVDPKTVAGIEVCTKAQEKLDSLLLHPPKLKDTDRESAFELLNLANISMGAVLARSWEDPDRPIFEVDRLVYKVIKHMMTILHPDIEGGDAELYKIASSVYETLKRDRVNSRRED
jgi:hypothetical protein